jgi:acyl-CoA thioesterase-1
VELAKQYGVPLLPFLLDGLAYDLGNFQDDQVHPTAAAQPLIRDRVHAWLEPVLP